MKRLLFPLAGIAAVAVIWFIFEYNPCKKPQPLQVSTVALNCAMDFFNRPIEDVRADACKYLNREPNCDFTKEDKVQVLDMIDTVVLTCTKKYLTADGFCTDKVTKKGLLQ